MIRPIYVLVSLVNSREYFMALFEFFWVQCAKCRIRKKYIRIQQAAPITLAAELCPSLLLPAHLSNFFTNGGIIKRHSTTRMFCMYEQFIARTKTFLMIKPSLNEHQNNLLLMLQCCMHTWNNSILDEKFHKKCFYAIFQKC